MPLPSARRPTQAQRRTGGHFNIVEAVKHWIAWRLLPRSLLDPGPRATYLGSNRVLVSTMIGRHTFSFYIEADDRLLAPGFITTGKFEIYQTNYFLRSLAPDSHCLDIGANFGFYTCLMAKSCPQGRVLGIEPDSKIVDLAKDNICINDLYGRADILPLAVCDKEGLLTLYRRASRSGNTSIVHVSEGLTTELGEPPAEPFTVASTCVDQLAHKLAGKVDFIKIDVEGAEPLVLKGAKETIRRNRNIAIVMEWSPGQIAAAGFDVAQFVRDIGGLGLHPYQLNRFDERPIPHDALIAMPYQAGILLRRADHG